MIYFLFLLTYLIGYLSGYLNGKHKDSIEAGIETINQSYSFVKGKIKQIITPTINTGVIPTPTAKDLFNRKLPQQVKDGRQAMKETLDTIPELVDAKNKVAEYNKNDWTRG